MYEPQRGSPGGGEYTGGGGGGHSQYILVGCAMTHQNGVLGTGTTPKRGVFGTCMSQ